MITEEGGFEDDPDLTGLGVERLMDDVLYAALPVDHPLATRRAIALTDLHPRGLDARRPAGHLPDSNIVLRACAQAGFEPRVAYTSDDYFAIQGLVASGMGVALVPGLALASPRDDVAVRPLGPPAVPADGGGHRGESVGWAIPTMLDCLRDAGSVYAESGLAAAA